MPATWTRLACSRPACLVYRTVWYITNIHGKIAENCLHFGNGKTFYFIYWFIYRYAPIVDPTDVFVSPLSMIQYTPQAVTFTISVPMNPLIAGGLGALISSSQTCRVTSSVKYAALSLTTTSSSISNILLSLSLSAYFYSSLFFLKNNLPSRNLIINCQV